MKLKIELFIFFFNLFLRLKKLSAICKLLNLKNIKRFSLYYKHLTRNKIEKSCFFVFILFLKRKKNSRKISRKLNTKFLLS